MARHKDIQFASRGKSHVARQAQIHRLRHVVRESTNRLPTNSGPIPCPGHRGIWLRHADASRTAAVAPTHGEDHTKDIDFTRSGIESRWKAGYDHARKVLAEKPWQGAGDMLAGVVIHEASE